MSRWIRPAVVAGLAVTSAGCSDADVVGATSGADAGASSGTAPGDGGGATSEIPDTGADTTLDDTGAPQPREDHLDILVVVDDGPSMLAEQANVARTFATMVRRLEDITDAEGNPLNLDVHLMVTSTSVGNPLCDGPASGGTPVVTACVDRLEDFADPAAGVDAAAACQDVCPSAVVPPGGFIAFHGETSNVVGTPGLDLDGDGEPESAAAQAISCLGPQGIAGCRYGSALEAMRAALAPDAPWNTSPDPFLREHGALAIMFITDGVDCSGADAATMDDVALWEIDPATGRPAASEAICWNAGVQCEGPDAMGTFGDCAATPGPLTPAAQYSAFLHELGSSMDKVILMLGAVGVPPVEAHSVGVPFHPVEGGIHALQVREWSTDDLTPPDVAAGVSAADKHFELGIGPGCTGVTRRGDVIGQAVPPIRIAEVCTSLDVEREDSDYGIRCCLESVCDDDFANALGCLYVLLPPPIIYG